MQRWVEKYFSKLLSCFFHLWFAEKTEVPWNTWEFLLELTKQLPDCIVVWKYNAWNSFKVLIAHIVNTGLYWSLSLQSSNSSSVTHQTRHPDTMSAVACCLCFKVGIDVELADTLHECQDNECIYGPLLLTCKHAFVLRSRIAWLTIFRAQHSDYWF